MERKIEREQSRASLFPSSYDLSINKYKKTEYVPVEYPPTSEILEELDKLNEQITSELAELKELLK